MAGVGGVAGVGSVGEGNIGTGWNRGRRTGGK